MMTIRRISLLAGAATLTLTGGSFADTAVEAQNEELRARIAELESRLGNVEAQSSDNWLTEQRATEIRSLVEDVMADADTRSSMLSQGMTAGYDNGAVIASADGNWLLRTNLLLQTRFIFSTLDTGNNVPAFDGTRWGFEVTRAKFSLTGNVVSPEWFYRVDIETSTNANGVATDTRTGLLEAYAGYDFGNGWKVYGGQFKAPLLFEEMVEDQFQQAVERSLVNYLYTGGYTQGIAVDYLGDQFHVVGSWNNGITDTGYGGTITTGTGGSALQGDTNFGLTARGEWLAMGTWDQFKDITSPQGEEMGVKVGGAFHWQRGEYGLSGTVTGATNSLAVITGDISAEFGGANVYGQINYSVMDFKSPAVGPALDGSSNKPWGIVIGGGWYFSEEWELFGRYEWSDRSVGSTPGNPDNLNIITVGVNRYFAGHNAKWTTDVGFGLQSVDVGLANGTVIAPVTGWRQDVASGAGGANNNGQLLIRTQLQILF
jgi:hypothetical protein